jgi:LAO/AO transport system ATPase
MSTTYKPEWAPEGAGKEFAGQVMIGVSGGHDGMTEARKPTVQKSIIRRPRLTTQDYIDGVLSRDRSILSRAITLVESNAQAHFQQAQEVIQAILPYTGSSTRVGITGVPGAGKSTFIEAFGSYLCQNDKRIAVLAVDPSSTVSRGSILGDKTRMENLAKEKNAFIRPSPSGGTLGGLTRKSRETLLLCEAAGYDVILVETVGVGQSETTVRSMVDFFLLIVITGAGDELQGMKKGVMELADAVLVNKADGDNKLKAMTTKVEYDRILHYLRQATEGWETRAHTCSSLTGEGVPEIWEMIQTFCNTVNDSGVFGQRRKNQTLSWVYSMVEEYLMNSFYNSPGVAQQRDGLEKKVVGGELSATRAVQEFINAFSGSRNIEEIWNFKK